MRRHTISLFMLLALSTPLVAQDAPPAGIALRGGYSASERPIVGVRQFAGSGVPAAAVDSMRTIIERDLAYSDRFEMAPRAPSTLATGPVDYAAWNSLRVWYLVTGDVTVGGEGYDVTITLHDVVYSKVKATARYRIPAAGLTAYHRLALHAIADEVVRVITDKPGSAASRIVLARQNKASAANATGSYDILMVDSDGFGLKRVGGTAGLIYSPVWSPDGKKLAYMLAGANGQQIVERNIESGATRVITGAVGAMTPRYSPDGSRISFSAWAGSGPSANYELMEIDAARTAGPRRITSSRGMDQSPTYSADGSRVAFTSDRLGLPHIYVMPVSGGSGTQLTPYVAGSRGYYFGPDWSPTSDEIVFAGHWNSRGVYQIMIADARRAGGQIRQLTNGGDNEDPSWAPDGRHIVYSSGVGDQQLSLYVIDAVTEAKRKLVDGGNSKLRMSDWSPILARATDYVVR